MTSDTEGGAVMLGAIAQKCPTERGLTAMPNPMPMPMPNANPMPIR